ncbi:MAG: hypothetical protein H6684_04870 [Deltaproteobacteria bacterium]|nr:hypothetical protein [Deltaproteobacteria bacterium]MCB9488046.1 hypothetical protein [Deltaproteobacteria bacterium]
MSKPSFTDTIVDHLQRHRPMFHPIVAKCLECGFSVHMIKNGADLDMAPFVDNPDLSGLYPIAADHALPDGGTLDIRLGTTDLTSCTFDQDANSFIELVFLKGNARAFLKQMPGLIGQVREILFANFGNETIFELIDFGADYLVDSPYEFSYTIIAFDGPIMVGRMHRDEMVFKVSLDNPLAFIRLALFYLKGADALAMSFRSPFDILNLLDMLQSSLCHLAQAYEERGMRLVVSGLGQKLLSCGAGVKPNLMTSRFGPTALHLDAIFKIISSALSRDS